MIAVYTQPDKPAGRDKKLQASPVKQLAAQHQIPVYQPKSLRKPETQAELTALQADVMVVVAYGLILPQAVLDALTYGCLNVHGSLLRFLIDDLNIVERLLLLSIPFLILYPSLVANCVGVGFLVAVYLKQRAWMGRREARVP